MCRETKTGSAQIPCKQGGLAYLPVHDDINADPIGFDECASNATIYFHKYLANLGQNDPETVST